MGECVFLESLGLWLALLCSVEILGVADPERGCSTFLYKEIAYHPEPDLTGNYKPVLHVHEYKRDNFSDREPRLLTKFEYEKYKKYFKGVTINEREYFG